MKPFVLGFGCIIMALLCVRISNACKRTVEITKDWPGERQERNRTMATVASKILLAAAGIIGVGGIVGAILLAMG